ncbi:MAG: acylphosphatase [Nitrospinae bacterium]|nr:acylphosphatase [Nitrospinota bacterium]MZH41496.1 acylphosphatase [Nitrospinota bacterium]
MLTSVHLIVRGLVQGVWFRAGTREQALKLGLCGWAKNCPDGTVEIHAEGEKESLEKLIEWCRTGPSAAEVSSLDIEWVEPQGLTTFEIHH